MRDSVVRCNTIVIHCDEIFPEIIRNHSCILHQAIKNQKHLDLRGGVSLYLLKLFTTNSNFNRYENISECLVAPYLRFCAGIGVCRYGAVLLLYCNPFPCGSGVATVREIPACTAHFGDGSEVGSRIVNGQEPGDGNEDLLVDNQDSVFSVRPCGIT